MQNAKQRKADDDAEQGGAAVSMHAEPKLTLEDARMIEGLYVRGGAKKLVSAGMYSSRQLRDWRERGLIDTVVGLKGGVQAALTVRALQLLAPALQLIAASPGASR